MTTQINQLTELTSTSDGDLLLIRENATGVDKKMQASNLRAKATTKGDVGLGDVDNVSAANLRDRSTHTGTQPLSTISDSGTMASQDANSVNIDGGTIDGTAVNATNLAYTGTLTGGTGVVNLGSGQVVKDASGNVGVGTTSPEARLEVSTGSADIYENIRLHNRSSGNHTRWGINCNHGDNTKADIQLFNGVSLSDNTSNFINVGGGQPGTGYSGVSEIRFITTSTPGTAETATEAMRIDSSGHAIIPAGVTLGTSAGVYNAANTLDDYETGTWTPAWSFPSGSVTHDTQDGRYTKIGNKVYIEITLQTSAISSPSGDAAIVGLPFAPNASIPTGTMSIGYIRRFATDMPNLVFLINTDNRILAYKNATNASGVTDLSGSDFNGGVSQNTIYLSGFYTV